MMYRIIILIQLRFISQVAVGIFLKNIDVSFEFEVGSSLLILRPLQTRDATWYYLAAVQRRVTTADGGVRSED